MNVILRNWTRFKDFVVEYRIDIESNRVEQNRICLFSKYLKRLGASNNPSMLHHVFLNIMMDVCIE